MDAAIHFAAHKVGLGALKPKQVEAFASGSDVFVSLPTGYGKSFCYVLLPLVFDQLLGRSGSIVLCISPLTSLMMEQRSKFSKLGLCCEYVGCSWDVHADCTKALILPSCSIIFAYLFRVEQHRILEPERNMYISCQSRLILQQLEECAVRRFGERTSFFSTLKSTATRSAKRSHHCLRALFATWV